MKFVATASGGQTVEIPITVNFEVPCQYTEDQFVWKENTNNNESVKNKVVQNYYDVHRDYLATDVPIFSQINPFATTDGSLIYEDLASNNCAV